MEILLVLSASSSVARYREGSKKHLDDLVTNSDFPVLHCLGIGLSIFGIGSYHIGKYMSNFQPIPRLICLLLAPFWWTVACT
jgi:hypothetical protein